MPWWSPARCTCAHLNLWLPRRSPSRQATRALNQIGTAYVRAHAARTNPSVRSRSSDQPVRARALTRLRLRLAPVTLSVAGQSCRACFRPARMAAFPRTWGFSAHVGGDKTGHGPRQGWCLLARARSMQGWCCSSPHVRLHAEHVPQPHVSATYLERKDFARQGKATLSEAVNLRGESSVERKQGGRDESERRRAESQWIVAARPLCHLQYPVAYLSSLQRILPAARWESRFKAALAALPSRGPDRRHVPLGTGRSLLQVGNRAAGARVALARILT